MEAVIHARGEPQGCVLAGLVVAHQRRVAALGPPRGGWDVAARVAAGRAWYGSYGAQRELRQLRQQGLVDPARRDWRPDMAGG